MPQSDELRRKRQRKTKAQLIDELEAADARLATSTDRKLAEERLHQSQTMLLDAVNNISEGFVLYDADDRLVLCNQTWRDIYGYTAEEAHRGVKYADLVRLDVEKAVIDTAGGSDNYLDDRMA